MGIENVEIDSLWHLHDELTIDQAAALIAGYDPGDVEQCKEDPSIGGRFSRLYAAKAALLNAITAKRLKCNLRFLAREYGYADQMADDDIGEANFGVCWGSTADEGEVLSKDHSFFYNLFPDWSLSTVSRSDLLEWLEKRGMTSGFLFSTAAGAPDYLDSSNPRYAPKLAAAVRAWQAVTDPNGRHPKQALLKWLRENAAEFGLSDEEGKPNETGIEEIAKVANWQPGGGAPRTPGE